MSPSAQRLISIYEEWRRETLAEGAAISIDDWTDVSEIQARKILLRRKIESGGISGAPSSLTGEDELLVRAFVAELIRLEMANDTAISAKRREAEEERASIDATTGNLRRVQRYGRPSESAWVAYS